MSWSLSVAAVMSVSPVKFAGATGMNIACRQVGGAVGIAVMTVIVADNPGAKGYELSYLVCGVCALATAAAAAGFKLARPTAEQTAKQTSRPEATLTERTGR
jgi:hypothetical protein